MRPIIPTCAALLLFLTSAPAAAQGPPSAEALRFDIEVDPLAYALDGHSLHVGVGQGRWRLDLGNFALALPGWVHGQPGYEAAFQGYGAKLELFWDATRLGGFVGLESSYTVMRVVNAATREQGEAGGVGASVRAGWRFELPAGFFVVPWVGVGYRCSADTVRVGAGSFAQSPWTVFPTVHLGYQIP